MIKILDLFCGAGGAWGTGRQDIGLGNAIERRAMSAYCAPFAIYVHAGHECAGGKDTTAQPAKPLTCQSPETLNALTRAWDKDEK